MSAKSYWPFYIFVPWLQLRTPDTLHSTVMDQPTNPRFTFNDKWEIHKPFVERLYLDEKLKLPKIQAIIRSEHDFDAVQVPDYCA
jgi:hypothetical protein